MSSQFNWIDQDLPSAAHLSSGFPEFMVLLDCETTGGNANYHRIIEVGLIVIEHGEVIEEWQSFINPNTTLPESIQRLTGITPGMLRDAPKFSAVSECLLSKIEGRTLVAHNARFDYSFLKNENDFFYFEDEFGRIKHPFIIDQIPDNIFFSKFFREETRSD